jgi:hypothetical protein
MQPGAPEGDASYETDAGETSRLLSWLKKYLANADLPIDPTVGLAVIAAVPFADAVQSLFVRGLVYELVLCPISVQSCTSAPSCPPSAIDED